MGNNYFQNKCRQNESIIQPLIKLGNALISRYMYKRWLQKRYIISATLLLCNKNISNFLGCGSIPSPRLVASPRLKNLVCATIYP